MASAAQSDEIESYGVLVGWTHKGFQDKLDLRLQFVQSTRKLERDEIDAHHVVMTREQAAVLANYLYKVSGHTPPNPRKGLLRRWFGS